MDLISLRLSPRVRLEARAVLPLSFPFMDILTIITITTTTISIMEMAILQQRMDSIVTTTTTKIIITIIIIMTEMSTIRSQVALLLKKVIQEWETVVKVQYQAAMTKAAARVTAVPQIVTVRVRVEVRATAAVVVEVPV